MPYRRGMAARFAPRRRDGPGARRGVAGIDAVLHVLAVERCRFVVVGSAARALVGEPVTPRDLDIVVDGRPDARPALIAALDALRARIEVRTGWLPIGRAPALPWDWGWTVRTPFGSIDVITRFVDGSDFAHHDGVAESVELASGDVVRCHPTRRP